MFLRRLSVLFLGVMSGGADQKIQHVKRVQEVDEDCVTKKRKTDLGDSNEDRRYPKKKVVLLVAYSGKGYYGMQVQTSAGFFVFVQFSSIPLVLNVFHVSAESQII